MRSKAASYINLLNVSYASTALADPLAGLIVSSPAVDVFKLPFLLAASLLIHMGGSALAGFAERRHGPGGDGAPEQNGSASPGGALSLGAVLIIAGVVSATGAGLLPFLVSLALSVSVVACNSTLKKEGAPQAACLSSSRALNLVLGMSAGTFDASAMLAMPFIIFAFVFTASLLGGRKGEDLSPRIGQLSGWIAACLALEYLLISGQFSGEGLLFATLFHIVSGIAVLSAHSSQARGKAAAQSLMISIPLLDASFSSGISGVMAGFPVAAMALPAVTLSRRD